MRVVELRNVLVFAALGVVAAGALVDSEVLAGAGIAAAVLIVLNWARI